MDHSLLAELLGGDLEVKVFTTQVSDYIQIINRMSKFSSWTTLLKVEAIIKRLRSGQKCFSDDNHQRAVECC